ncbi:MAG: hypothetical protein KJI70_00235 [Patescibacteria group bacterium]|nr:hypothetical protein [Patescibacteria group bacterium]
MKKLKKNKNKIIATRTRYIGKDGKIEATFFLKKEEADTLVLNSEQATPQREIKHVELISRDELVNLMSMKIDKEIVDDEEYEIITFPHF